MNNQTNKKAPNNGGDDILQERLRSIWLGWRDSNPRMHGPKPCALPLGHTPSSESQFWFCFEIKFQKHHLKLSSSSCSANSSVLLGLRSQLGALKHWLLYLFYG